MSIVGRQYDVRNDSGNRFGIFHLLHRTLGLEAALDDQNSEPLLVRRRPRSLIKLCITVNAGIGGSSAAIARAAATYSTVAAKLTVLVSPYPLAACLWHLIVPLFSLWSPVIGADCPSPGRSMRTQPDIHASFATSPLCNVTCITFILFLMSLIASFFLGL